MIIIRINLPIVPVISGLRIRKTIMCHYDVDEKTNL